MGKLLAYSGTTAKIKALRSHLLTLDDYQQLASAKSVTEALTYLTRHIGYDELFAKARGSTLHRGDIEKILTNAIYIDFQKIYRFAPVAQRKFLDLYFHRYEIALLKTCMRMVFDHRDVTIDLRIFENFFQKHSNIDLRKISESRSIDEFVANLKGSDYYAILNRLSHLAEPNLRDYESAIDLFYFKWFWKEGEKILSKEQYKYFKESYGTKMDLLNIRWIYRSRHYFQMSAADIYALLIPVNYHLRDGDIRKLVEAAGDHEFDAAVKQTYYGRRYDNYTALTLDEMYVPIRQRVQRKAASREPYSIATVIAYLFDKEHEIDKLTTVLEGVRYGLPQDQILEYVH